MPIKCEDLKVTRKPPELTKDFPTFSVVLNDFPTFEAEQTFYVYDETFHKFYALTWLPIVDPDPIL